MAAVSANKLELLQIADAVAREKSIDRSIVIAAMEDAIAKAARARYGSETDVHAEIDAKNKINEIYRAIGMHVTGRQAAPAGGKASSLMKLPSFLKKRA